MIPEDITNDQRDWWNDSTIGYIKLLKKHNLINSKQIKIKALKVFSDIDWIDELGFVYEYIS